MTRFRREASCSDCESRLDRRDFLVAGAAAAGALGLPAVAARSLLAAPTGRSGAEVAVAELYASLDDSQRKIVALPLDDPRRTKINPNWSITSANIGSFTKVQQELIHRVLKGITSEDGYARFVRQMTEDWGSVDKYSIAIFGDPQGDAFEFELTGRHLTLRADGDTTGAAAFGGPIVYGHSKKGNSDANLFSHQTKRANEVFAALDEKQRAAALLETPPGESAVALRKPDEAQLGIAGKDLSADQKELVLNVLRDILAPYRQEDVDEAMEAVKAGGGVDALSIAFFRQGDLDDDKQWDIWRLEGPTLTTHFRGAPHVHAYINIAKQA
ncbi:MAG: DUF3500 domain-containing protein [Planctomycetales bacterium]|nr:DUF3500 domain-containing protein [Planctomycetales bacterium]